MLEKSSAPDHLQSSRRREFGIHWIFQQHIAHRSLVLLATSAYHDAVGTC